MDLDKFRIKLHIIWRIMKGKKKIINWFLDSLYPFKAYLTYYAMNPGSLVYFSLEMCSTINKQCYIFLIPIMYTFAAFTPSVIHFHV